MSTVQIEIKEPQNLAEVFALLRIYADSEFASSDDDICFIAPDILCLNNKDLAKCIAFFAGNDNNQRVIKGVTSGLISRKMARQILYAYIDKLEQDYEAKYRKP